MAIEDDYNRLVFNLHEITDELTRVQEEVAASRLREANEHLDVNATNWVNLIGIRLTLLEARFMALKNGARRVLNSKPGERVFDDE